LRDRKQQEAMRRPACLCYARARTVAPLCERRLLPEEQPAVIDRRYSSQREIAATDAEIDELVYDLPARRGGPARLGGPAAGRPPFNSSPTYNVLIKEKSGKESAAAGDSPLDTLPSRE